MTKLQENIYAPNYKVEDGCLMEVRSNRQGPYDQKLCNFLPWLVSEIAVDNGIEKTTRIVLSGVHADGHTLPEVEIPASEFAGFGWLFKYWGMDCNLETAHGVKDSLRYAIQSTAPNAEHRSAYEVTGWHDDNGSWQFLMPGDDAQTVVLPGNMKGYHMERRCDEADTASALALMEAELAPAEIIWPMLAFTFLSPLNHFLRLAGCEPKFVLFLVGKTGSRKSTLAALFLSFFGVFNGANLPLSFRDTANSVLHHTFTLKDVLTCIDDFHPTGRKETTSMNAMAQAIMRAYGDRTGRGRLRADASPMESLPPQGNAIITAEFPPDIGESGTARYFALELMEGDVNLEVLTAFQKQSEDGTLQRCMYGYLEWLKETYLWNVDGFLSDLKTQFEYWRDAFRRQCPNCHGRVPEAAAWLVIGMRYLLSYLQDQLELAEAECESYRQRFYSILKMLAERQASNIVQDKPTHKFLQKLYALLESGQNCLLPRHAVHEYLPPNCLGYEDDTYLYLFSEIALEAVQELCDRQGEAFNIKNKELLKQLAQEGVLEPAGKQNTKSIRFDGKSKRVACLYKRRTEQIRDLAS